MTSDLLDTSAATWRDHAGDPPRRRPALASRARRPARAQPRPGGCATTCAAQEAERVYMASRNPERGWPGRRRPRRPRLLPRPVARRRSAPSRCSSCSTRSPPAAALVVPRLLGDLVDRTVDAGGGDRPRRARLAVVGVVVVQALFTFFAQWTSTLFGQDLLASAREYIVRAILRLPLGQVESASTGDLVTRVTRDVGTMSRSVQYGLPMAIISLLTVALSVVAMLLNSVLLAVPSLVVIGTLSGRPQLPAARPRATSPRARRTPGSTRRSPRPSRARAPSRRSASPGAGSGAGDDDIEVSAQAERYTMSLRNLLFAVIDVAFNTPRVVTLVVGACGYAQGWVDLGQITAAVLYVEALCGPLDRLVGERRPAAGRRRVDHPAARHRRGAAGPRARRRGARRRRAGRPTTCASPTARATTCCTASTSTCAPASGSPSSAQRARASRRSAGCSRASTARAPARPPSAGSTWSTCRWRCCAPRSPSSPRSTTSSSARCGTTSCSRARTPTTTPCGRRSRRSTPCDWVERLPEGLDTRIGSGQHRLTPAQAQQIALARLIIADPHTLVLDEATSLIDPRTARTSRAR